MVSSVVTQPITRLLLEYIYSHHLLCVRVACVCVRLLSLVGIFVMAVHLGSKVIITTVLSPLTLQVVVNESNVTSDVPLCRDCIDEILICSRSICVSTFQHFCVMETTEMMFRKITTLNERKTKMNSNTNVNVYIALTFNQECRLLSSYLVTIRIARKLARMQWI